MSTEIAAYNATAPAVSTSAIAFDPGTLQAMQRLAEAMAAARVTVPKHLAGSPGDCLAVVMQAAQWGMNPFAVAQKTHIVNGTLGYEAQLVNAVACSTGAIRGRFHYEYRGEGADIECRVGAIPAGESEIVWNEWLSAASVQVKNSPLWKTNPKQQLGYLQVKNWARQYAPGAILGVYSVDELAEIPVERPVTATVVDEPTEQSASRTESVKARLRQRKAAEPDAPTLAQVTARIEAAEFEADLGHVAELAAKLADPEDKAMAREAFAAKLRAIRAAAEGEQAQGEGQEVEQAGGDAGAEDF